MRSARAGVHRLDDGREPQHEGHRDGQRDQQPGAHHRQHRPRRRLAVLDHRPVQRDGHARGRLRVEHAGLSQVRERRGSRASWPRSGTSPVERIPDGARPRLSRHHRGGARHAASARSGSSPPTRSSRSPTSASLRQALEALDFLVVQDGYHPTPTSEFAHLMLPAAIWGEKEGTYTNSERRVSKVNRAVAPPGEARSDFDIFLGLADALGVRDELFPGWTKPADAFEEWKRVSAGRLCDYSGMTYRPSSSTAACSGRSRRERCRADEPRRLYADGEFQTDDGRAQADPVHVGAVSRAAEQRVPVRAEHRPHGRALAHAHQDRRRCRSSSGCRRTPGSR